MKTIRRTDGTSLRMSLAREGADPIWSDVVAVAEGRYSPAALDLGFGVEACVAICLASIGHSPLAARMAEVAEQY